LNFVKSWDECMSQKHVALNIILASFNKRTTQRNRNILWCHLLEFQADRDYRPWNDEQKERFFKDRDIKRFLD